MLPKLTSPLSNATPIRIPLDRRGKLTFTTPRDIAQNGIDSCQDGKKVSGAAGYRYLTSLKLLDSEHLLPLLLFCVLR